MDPQQAIATLEDIADIAGRVRQSRLYQHASLIVIYWGVLVALGNIATAIVPGRGALIWLAINGAGCIGSILAGMLSGRKSAASAFAARIFIAFGLIFIFGLFWTLGLAHFAPRAVNAFWATYFMLIYCVAGLFAGTAFVIIGLAITAGTIIGYYFAGSWFDVWMAVIDGGRLIIAGLWMRRR